MEMIFGRHSVESDVSQCSGRGRPLQAATWCCGIPSLLTCSSHSLHCLEPGQRGSFLCCRARDAEPTGGSVAASYEPQQAKPLP